MEVVVDVVSSEPGSDPRSATVSVNGVPVIIITQGDEESDELFATLVTNARTVARETAKAVLQPSEPF